jgi:hypothetical protein
MKKILGIDIGGVIIDRINEKTDTSFFNENYLQSTACPNAFEKIHALQQEYFKENVHLISKCGKKIQDKTLSWLTHHKFYTQTGIEESRVHFCRERREKKEICKQLGITHFVDDRLEILSYLLEFVPHLYLFSPRDEEVNKFKQHLSSVSIVHTWDECYQEIKRTF